MIIHEIKSWFFEKINSLRAHGILSHTHFMTLNTFINKQPRLQINEPSIQLKELEEK